MEWGKKYNDDWLRLHNSEATHNELQKVGHAGPQIKVLFICGLEGILLPILNYETRQIRRLHNKG